MNYRWEALNQKSLNSPPIKPIKVSKREKKYKKHQQKQSQRIDNWENKINQQFTFIGRCFLRLITWLVIKTFSLIYYSQDWIYLHQIKRKRNFTQRMVFEIKWYHFFSWVFRTLFFLLMVLIIIFPFYWMISIAFRSSEEILEGINGTLSLWPKSWSWGAFEFLFKNPKAKEMGVSFPRAILMSLLITFLSVASQTIVSLITSYGLTQFRRKTNQILVTIILAAMILPLESLMVGQYLLITKINLKDSLMALILPFIGNAFTILMFVQAFQNLPYNLKAAAKVDGLSSFNFFLKVALPAIKSTIMTAILIATINSWNAILWPTMVIQENKSYYTISMILWQIMQSTGDPQGIWSYDNLLDPQNLKMAASIVAILPMMILFLISKKYLIKGLNSSLIHYN